MRLSTPFLTLTLALTTIAHPITTLPNQPHHPNPVSAAIAPPQNNQVQLLLAQRLVIARPERETLGWRAEKWAVAVRWWKGAVTGVMVEEEEEKDVGWNGGGVSAGDRVGGGEEGVRVMEALEGDEVVEQVKEEETECGVVGDKDEGDGDEEGEEEEEDGQLEL